MSSTTVECQPASSLVPLAKPFHDSTTNYSTQNSSSTDTLVALRRSTLCQRCQSLHLDWISAVASEEGSLSTLGFEAKLTSLDSSCGLCSLLQNIALGRNRWALIDKQHMNKEPPENVMIQEIALYAHNHLSRTSYSKVVIEKSRLRHPLTYRNLQKIVPLQVDYSALRKKLEYCTASHQELECGRRLSVNILYLRVINCATRKIEMATAETKYAALTYVWGPPTASSQRIRQQSSPDFLSEVAEKTIEDAIIVTEMMGFQFIWIDRYCINQNDPNKHHQIRQMDLIYRNAELTIVAAAGDNPSFGIPGVSTISRGSLSAPLIGNFAYLALDNQEQSVRNSKWSTRAWTYQEFRFSRRRLVFTENEASFCCCVIDMTTGSEANECATTWQRNVEERDVYSSIRWIKTAYGVGSHPWDITDRISEYSTKDLTYPSDALNAFSGILRAFEDLEHPVYHLWGVPVLPPVFRGSSRDELSGKSKELNDTVPIARSSSDGFIVGLCWKNSGLTTRRSLFPSWSWAGWKGPIKWNSSTHPFQSHDPWVTQSDIRIDVELSSGSVIAWEKFEELSYLKDSPSEIGHTLHLRNVYTFQVRLKHFDSPEWWLRDLGSKHGKPGFYAEIFAGSREKWYTPVYFLDASFESTTIDGQFGYRTFTAVVLGTLEGRGDYPFAILVDECGDVAQRIGHLSLGVGQVFTDLPGVVQVFTDRPAAGRGFTYCPGVSYYDRHIRIPASATKRRDIRIC